MKRTFMNVSLFLMAIAVAAPAPAQTSRPAERSAPDPGKLLAQSDLSRNGWESYEVVTVIKNYVDGELKEEGSFDTSIKGDDRTLVKFLNADVKGQYLLMLEDGSPPFSVSWGTPPTATWPGRGTRGTTKPP